MTSQAELGPCVCDKRNSSQRWSPGVKQKELLKAYILLRDGPGCFKKCGKPGTQLAHRCNNKACENREHLVLECVSCNNREKTLRFRQSAKASVSVSVHGAGADGRETVVTDPIKINRVSEPYFLVLLRSGAFLGSGRMECREFHRKMARMTGLSVVTIRDRYVEKYLDDRLVRVTLEGVEYYALTAKGKRPN